MAARENKGKQSKGKKTRKYGRKRNSLAQQRYTAERRWEVNKKRKAQKYANKFNHSVRIKIEGEWETIRPDKIAAKAGEQSPAPIKRGVGQPGRSPDLGSGNRQFNSDHPDIT